MLPTTPRTEFMAGLRAILPIQLGVLPFALITGVAAASIGMTAVQGIGMSLIVFAGAAQLVGIQLLDTHAPLLVIWLSTFFINLRFVMYSSSLATHLPRLPLRWKLLVPYLLTDQAYAMSILAFTQEPKRPFKQWFYLGAALTLWLVWMSATAVGAIVGVLIPASWSLNFAAPLTFLALVMATIKDRSMIVAAVIAGATAVLAHPLPYRTGLIVAALAGIAAGLISDKLRR
ncbi:MAG: AzlC family ABC transporter permease [Chloroflexi bacterium]|nr:AzlC family ABC transporter permease [Chloroflexota bacterium]MBP7042467.1 AzlC family ABC transporter permease [Chloroflexota bacterium]